MIRYILRRILLLVPVLVGLSILVFCIARLLPGDPVRLAAGPNANAADIASVAREFGLDRPFVVQYWDYATGLLRGDWGVSIFTRRPVAEDLAVYLPATLELVLAAMVLAVGLGIPAGLLAAVYRNRWPDFLSRTVSLGAISMPRFFLGLVFQLAFAMWLGWLPLSGRFPLTEDPPPTITSSVPSQASFGVRLSGASISVMPLGSSSAARRVVTAGSDVEQSMMSSGLPAEARPSGPLITASTCGLPVTQSRTMSQASASSRALPASAAPRCFRSSTGSRLRWPSTVSG